MKITQMMTRAIALAGACFMGFGASATTYYASPAGGGDGLGADSPTTLDAAVAAATTEGDKVVLADGTYERTATLTISAGVTMQGTSREGTIITRKSGTIRLIELKHINAVLRDMTVQNGYYKTGANILLNFGTVENCIVQGGYCWDNGIGGSAIAVYDGANSVKSSGTIRNCIFRNNLAVPTQYDHSGYAVWCRKTSYVLIEGCQFYDNKSYCNFDWFVSPAALGIYSDADGVVVRNCTFARNRGTGGGAIYSAKNTAIVTNCVFWGNTARRADSEYRDIKGSYKAVTYCAFDGALPSQANKTTCKSGALSFRDAANNDFTPIGYDSVAAGAGAYGEDLGALAATHEGCFFRSSITAAHAVPLTTTFTGSSEIEGTYSWNFGDGSAVETGKVVSHTFTQAGTYTVTLTVGSATHTETIVAAPATIDVTSVAEITQAIADAGDGTIINVAPNTYTFTSGTTDADYPCGPSALFIRKGLTLRGATGNPLQTIFKAGNNTFELDTNSGSPAKHGTKLRLLMIEHPDAKVENLTLFGGYVNGVRYFGGGAQIDYAGGTISNCVFTACANNDNAAGGAAVAQFGGLVTHCWITNNYSKVNANDGGSASALLYQRGVLRNSLVAGNRAYCNANYTWNTGGVALNGNAIVENCTIANNTGTLIGGIRQVSSSAIVRNCQIQNNSSSGEYKAADASKFVNCACTVEITGGKNCVQGALGVVNKDKGDWHPVLGSEALNAGLVQDWMTDAKDLDGNARLSDEGQVDAGCYQFQKSAVSGSIAFSKTEGPIPATITFTATVESEIGNVSTYIWDFGDGSDPVTTTEPTVSHTYTAIGSYTPSLKVGISEKQYAIANTVKLTTGPAIEYVVNAAVNPDEMYPYSSWDTATTNLQTAIDAAVAGTRIVLSTGVHTNKFTAMVSKDIVIEGTTANPNDTVIYRPTSVSAAWSEDVRRTLYLNSANAVLRNMTLRGGCINYATSTYGANVYITAEGGTVTNCFITEGSIGGSAPNGSAGSALGMLGGVVTHCVISNNHSRLASNDNGTGGSTLYLSAGRVEFSLITCNSVDDSNLNTTDSVYAQNFSRIVMAQNATVANCSIISNDVNRGWTVSRSDNSDKAKIVNCLIARNHSANELAGKETAAWYRQTPTLGRTIKTLDAMDHCAGEMPRENEVDETKFLCDTNLTFKVTTEAPWQPVMGLHDAARHAKQTDEMVGATYLDGTPVPAQHAAIGCYPAWGRGTGIYLK